jgi:Fur family ferric uptake transcriptional regulator
MRGLRATRQRVAVLQILRRAHGHPTAAELHRWLLREQPNVGLKTVYDALDSLVGAGLAACVAHGGAPCRYEANTAPHYHVECRSCGSLIDVPARADRQIRARTPLPSGFEIDEIHVTLRGRCPRRRKEN